MSKPGAVSPGTGPPLPSVLASADGIVASHAVSPCPACCEVSWSHNHGHGTRRRAGVVLTAYPRLFGSEDDRPQWSAWSHSLIQDITCPPFLLVRSSKGAGPGLKPTAGWP